MEYQKKIRAGLINKDEITATQRRLKCVLSSLKSTSIINPYATLINLPDDIPHPRKTLLLLLNFIDVITFFFQYQREQTVDESTGEIFIKTAPEDIELAFKLLKNSLFRRADELSTTARGFYGWLKKYLTEAKTKQFTALDIRKVKRIHPRTLNNYLNELKLFNYLQITGGNKHREGFIYKLTDINELTELQNGIEQSLKQTLENIKAEQPKPSKEKQQRTEEPEQKPKEEKTEPPKAEQEEPTFFEKHYKRKRINEKEAYTLKMILKLEAKEPNREYLSSDVMPLTGRSQGIEARYLKNLWEQGKLNREWRNRQYYYTLIKTSSKQVSKTPLSNLETQQA
jgi:DNA-binding HxlR family transcriptional regulator